MDSAHTERIFRSFDAGTANIRQRKQWFEEGLKAVHERLAPKQRMLVEYKPFEPAFYHTDLADWGMALLMARSAGTRRKCSSIPVDFPRNACR